MTRDSKLVDDLASLVTNAMGAAQGVRQEAEVALRHQVEKFMADFDFVSREEFEAMRDLAIKTREQAEILEERVRTLEADRSTSGMP